MTANRRDLLATASAAVVFGLAGPALADRRHAQPPPAKGINAASDAMLNRFANDIVDDSPETATGLGLDVGARAGLKSKLSDASWAAIEKQNAESVRRRGEMAAIDRKRLTGQSAIDYDSMAYALDLGVEAGKFDFGDTTFSTAMSEGATPYVVSQQSGAYSSVGEFLNSQHKIETKADCDAYLERMEAFAIVLDQESERVARDTGKGVVAPDFILDNTLGQLKGQRATAVAQAPIVRSLADRAAAKGISGDYAAMAAKILDGKINPALDRQIGAVMAARAKAGHDAGVWRFPDGEAYYAWYLKVGTSTKLTAAEIHQMGLDQNQAITARMDGVLKAQGLTQGTVGQRMVALTKDSRFLYPNTDEGRGQLLAYLNGVITAVRPKLAQMSKLALKAPVIVKRVPPDIQDGAGQGYMNFGSLDGSRPSIYYVNLKDTGNWPKFTLPSLTYHETVPGHAWQGAYLAEHKAPLIKSLLGFNAFIEGWALYAEQLGDELGLYADDPFGQLGYLQAQQFRACRLVADTGLHDKRWTREQTVQWLVENTGRAEGGMTSETDRYIGTPGQACGYKVGHTEILRLRDKAKTALGPKFDLRDYDDVVVRSGGVPLTVLETVVDGYVKSAKA
jgi:uncharacterized protein (DUF885 family)